ncbi:MAG: flagellar biosynthesis anti-sigma factor FlgM [Armatimonadetes bacterium]|nr:flagellar biosynthesis anti-sigma factor FlgM [Armatimonadota bacterium]
MKVSEEQVRKVIEAQKPRQPGQESKAVFETATLYDEKAGPPVADDARLIREVRDQVMAMPEVREELVSELKARVERGEYHVSADEIVEAIIRRAIADRMR